MLFLYRTLINIILIFSPIIILIRYLNKKEDLSRINEKFCIIKKNKKKKGKLIWFHGASVGEFKSIIPLIKKYEEKKEVTQILVTSNTLSSAKLISNFKLKKVIHQFFPIDNNLIIKKFLKYWKPSIAIFVDSEIWPNTIHQLKKFQIPIILVNARITNKSYLRWLKFKKFSSTIFSKFDLCISSNLESIRYLKILGSKKIKYFGNLKFAEIDEKKIKLNRKLLSLIKNKKIFCASSTHNPEEILIGDVHRKLKKKYKNFLTIIIPRHIHRTEQILINLKKLNLEALKYSKINSANRNVDIIVVDSFGITKSFFEKCSNVFLGGSFINHGGQNPLEAARMGCNIIHGPSTHNFKEIYAFLKKEKISRKVKSKTDIMNFFDIILKKKTNKNLKIKINLIGKKILNSCFSELELYS